MKTARILLPLLLASLSAAAATPRKKAAPAPPPPRLTVAMEGLVDRRTSSDFPPARLELGLKIEGEDAAAVLSASARVTKAEDDTGRSLLETDRTQEPEWREARAGEPPRPSVTLASPERKAKTLASVEGVLSAYLPARDPNAVVKVDRIGARKDRPPVVSQALARQKIRLRVLSKEGLEKEKKAEQAAKERKRQAAAKKKGGAGLEELGQAMGDALAEMFDRLFMMAGDNDLVLKVDDPDKKLFSLGLVGADGKAIDTYGVMEIAPYRIVRLAEPLPEGAALEVRLKTPASFAEVPFRLSGVALP